MYNVEVPGGVTARKPGMLADTDHYDWSPHDS